MHNPPLDVSKPHWILWNPASDKPPKPVTPKAKKRGAK